MRAVELFAGAGGLAMGISKAGFNHDFVIEKDRDTCITIRENQKRGIDPVAHWNLLEADVRSVRYSSALFGIDLLSGGPPCQPFSLGGKHQGHLDERDMFPEAVRAVRELQPKAFLFENVKGLMRESFSSYFQYIQLQLRYTDITKKANEDWQQHLSRLERHFTGNQDQGFYYRVVARLLNAANFGVPQKRERVMIVGFRSDLELEWSFPGNTHSEEALLWSQWVTGEYWEKHKISNKHRPEPHPRLKARIDNLKRRNQRPALEPWTTIRDVLSDLPDPMQNREEDKIFNHSYVQGARSYPGHTGSLYDEPAKTLKAGDHGVPGGENMLALYNGQVRYFTVRESARLQTFPDEYLFPVAWTKSMRQLGNAVPVRLGYVVAESIRALLHKGLKQNDR